ncbi:MAG: metallophosphoesterase [Balneolaceae bacterium]|nr:metallophosphoesterase [Balneolaceae bacterium]
MSAEHLFISDVHLGAHPPKKEAEIEHSLICLIKYAIRNKAKLYVLGDLFDYWMEFPNSDFIPQVGKPVLEAFKNYNTEVGQCLFVTGNHDNWTRGYFKSLGFDVEPNFRSLQIFDRNVLVMHGDGHWQNHPSLSRPLLHRILRSKLFLMVYQGILPKSVAINLMRLFSNTTRKIDDKDPNPLNNNAKFILEQSEVNVVLSGHDHIPRVETFNSGLYINLGTFFHHGTLVRGFENSFDLVHWDAESSTFTSFEKHHQHS